ncbi:hypothetical protein EXIGLDRAFT_704316 [Exidia glandulosa HHB12029]|uniref:F-box domain-containing protein n=1 Tax=Exidia glandulosa HHB12029 TaxID=1314781 RepID=A0A165KWV0_EXIGL|nr:hypothetical protein EXIGLDRAFT_704316 [Exidia glandulosa HHB12029]
MFNLTSSSLHRLINEHYRTAVYRLNDDLLSMIFFVISGPVDRLDHSLKSAILLSHICRRWRSLALSLARLWNTVHWRPGGRQHVEAALAALDRSRNAPLAVQIQLSRIPRSDDTLLSDLNDGHALLRAVLTPQHLRRMTDFSLSVSQPFWDDELLQPFFHPGRLAMPALRQLSLYFWMQETRTDLDVNIDCSDLKELHVVGLRTREPGIMVGPSTTRVALGCGDLKLTDVVSVLQHGSGLQSFEIGTILGHFTTIIHDIDPNNINFCAGRIAGTVANLRNFSVHELWSPGDFATLQDVISTSTIRCCCVAQSYDPIAEEAWVRFLDMPSLGDVVELRLSGSRGEEIEFIAAKHNRTRELYCDKATAFACLPLALDSHPAILSTLEALTLDIVKWTEYMDIVEARGARMPLLQRVHLIIHQYYVDKFGLEDEMEDYLGAPIDMPRLESVVFDIGRSTPPSVNLTIRFLAISIQLLRCMTRGNARWGVAFVGGEEAKAVFASRCEEIAKSVPEEEQTTLHVVAAAWPPFILGTDRDAEDA